jgi:hypothetical protein
MLQLICPFFGDLIFKGAAALSLLFVLALIWDAIWQKRQGHLMREWPKRKLAHPTGGGKTAGKAFKKFRGKFVLLAVISIVVILLLIMIREKPNTNDANGLADYSKYFQGDATRPALATGTPNSNAGETNLSAGQPSTHVKRVSLTYRAPQ